MEILINLKPNVKGINFMLNDWGSGYEVRGAGCGMRGVGCGVWGAIF